MTTKTDREGPKHVAIIMDGNGRWAVERGRPRTFGHHRGAERVREIVTAAPGLDIRVMTLFAFSTENWSRSNYEVKVLMSLFRRYIVREADDLDAADVQVRFIGERNDLPDNLQRLMSDIEARTADNTNLVLQIAISYGARAEIVRAAQSLAAQAVGGEIDASAIDEGTFADALYTGGVSDPDLVIRTSGEMRISNFLLWQVAYAELAFVEECWPDFTPERLAEVVRDCRGRERRFGKIASG